jgi:hypothetical protein
MTAAARTVTWKPLIVLGTAQFLMVLDSCADAQVAGLKVALPAASLFVLAGLFTTNLPTTKLTGRRKAWMNMRRPRSTGLSGTSRRPRW